MNPDDIRKRAEAMGLRATLCDEDTNCRHMFLEGKEFQMTCWGSLQAALDLVQAKELRQKWQEFEDEQYGAAMPRKEFEQMVKDGKCEVGRAYLVRTE